MKAIIIITQGYGNFQLPQENALYFMLPVLNPSLVRNFVQESITHGVTQFEFIVSEEANEIMNLFQKEYDGISFCFRSVYEYCSLGQDLVSTF